MAQPLAEGAGVVAPIVDGQRLVHGDSLELSGRGLDGVEHRHRLTVGDLHDQVRAGPDVLEHRGGACRRTRNADTAHGEFPPRRVSALRPTLSHGAILEREDIASFFEQLSIGCSQKR